MTSFYVRAYPTFNNSTSFSYMLLLNARHPNLVLVTSTKFERSIRMLTAVRGVPFLHWMIIHLNLFVTKRTIMTDNHIVVNGAFNPKWSTVFARFSCENTSRDFTLWLMIDVLSSAYLRTIMFRACSHWRKGDRWKGKLNSGDEITNTNLIYSSVKLKFPNLRIWWPSEGNGKKNKWFRRQEPFLSI